MGKLLDFNRLLEDKRVFISTGARGIGKEIAILFARQGAIVTVGGRNEAMLKATMQEIREFSPESKGYVVDLSNKEEVERICDNILLDFGGIDILVNTVGINVHKAVHECDDEHIQKIWNTNYLCALCCVRKFIPGMMERKSGNIVNISSIHGTMTMPGFGIYAGTKGAMNATSRAMALDYADYGIRVNNVSPGLILSDNVMDEILSYPEGVERDDFMDMLIHMQPLSPGKMEDIANAALYMASEMSAYVTGQTLLVDGGASIKAH